MSHTSDDTTRTCVDCGQTFPLTKEFFRLQKDKSGRYYFQHRCVGCRRAKERAYYEEIDGASKMSQWRKENPDKVHAAKARYAARHPDKVKAMKQRERRKNNEGYKRRGREYYHRDIETKRVKSLNNWYNRVEKNPEIIAETNHRRRARKLANGGSFTATELRALYISQQGKCWYCQAELGDTYHADHFMPLSKGGTNDIGNIRLACPGCNLSKNNKMPWEFGRLL